MKVDIFCRLSLLKDSLLQWVAVLLFRLFQAFVAVLSGIWIIQHISLRLPPQPEKGQTIVLLPSASTSQETVKETLGLAEGDQTEDKRYLWGEGRERSSKKYYCALSTQGSRTLPCFTAVIERILNDWKFSDIKGILGILSLYFWIRTFSSNTLNIVKLLYKSIILTITICLLWKKMWW